MRDMNDEHEFDRRVDNFWGRVRGFAYCGLVLGGLWYGLNAFAKWQEMNTEPSDQPIRMRYENQDIEEQDLRDHQNGVGEVDPMWIRQ